MSSTDEEWRPVVGYEGYYEVSNWGNVRSVDRVITSGAKRKGAMLTPWKFGIGHLSVSLNRGRSKKNKQVHRLVAEAFLPNPEGYPIVRHLDDVPDHNHVSNLRWGTYSENSYDAIRNGGRTYPFAEKSECINGHELNEENSFYRKNRRQRECRQCMRDRAKRYYWKKKAEGA